jgi:hypothetical protein
MRTNILLLVSVLVAGQRTNTSIGEEVQMLEVGDTLGPKSVMKTSSKSKSKAIPATGRGGLQGCEMLRIPHCEENYKYGRTLLPRKIIFPFFVPISVNAE